MSANSKRVIDWRNRTKERIIQSFGGKCGICGYNKCQRSLDLHHINASEKEFGLGSIRASPISWERIVVELRKCVLICGNCHGEVHDGVSIIPQSITRFDETYADYKLLEKLDRESKNRKTCPVCGTDMFNKSKTCSKLCAIKLRGTFKWEMFDLYDMFIVKQMKIGDISRLVGCSWNATKKRLRKLKLIS